MESMMNYLFNLSKKNKSVPEKNIKISEDGILDLSTIKPNKENITYIKELLKKTITLHLNLKWLNAISLFLDENKNIQALIFPEEDIKNNNEYLEKLEKLLLENNTITTIKPNPNKKTLNEFLKLNKLKQMFETDSLTIDSNLLKYIDIIINITKKNSEKNTLKNINYSINTLVIEEHVKEKLLKLLSYPFQYVNFRKNEEMVKLFKKKSDHLNKKTNILYIDLSESNIGDKWIFIQESLLLNQENLNTLNIKKNKIKNIGNNFSNLMKNPISTLNLSDNPIEDIINLSGFEGSKILNLYMANCNINAEKLQSLLYYLSNTSIKKLLLSDNPLIETTEIKIAEKIILMLKKESTSNLEKIKDLIEKDDDHIFIFCEILKIYEEKIKDDADDLIKKLIEKSQSEEKSIFSKISNLLNENTDKFSIPYKIEDLIKILLEESHKNVTEALSSFIENQKNLTEIYLELTNDYLEIYGEEKKKKSIHLTEEFFNSLKKSNIKSININTEGTQEEIKNEIKSKFKSIPSFEKEKKTNHKIDISDETDTIIRNEKIEIKNKLSNQRRRNSIFCTNRLSTYTKNENEKNKKKLSGSYPP